MNPRHKPLFQAATRPYLTAGISDWQFARGKLRYDPVFFSVLAHGVLPDRGHLIDLGCGRGVLLSLLAAAREQFRIGVWPSGWPQPPLNLVMHGLELRADRVKAARLALGAHARIDQMDIRYFEFSTCSAVIMLDVMLYLNEEDQLHLLEKTASALEPGGVLVLRETDAGAGIRFQITRWSEHLAEAVRGRFGQPLKYRCAEEWMRLLESLGFSVTVEPMSQGTPFANTLFVARRHCRQTEIFFATI